MRTSTFLWTTLCFATLGCSSSSSSGGGSGVDAGASAADPFVGTWNCDITQKNTYTQPTPGTATVPTSHLLYLKAGSSAGTLTADGVAPCVLTLSESGTSATLVAGQSCTSNGTSTYTGGSFTVSGRMITFDLEFNFMGTEMVDGGTVPLVSTATVNGTCTPYQ